MNGEFICYTCKYKGYKCPSPHPLSKDGNHWWSGWPGAYCMGCGMSYPPEICLAENCPCECHEGGE